MNKYPLLYSLLKGCILVSSVWANTLLAETNINTGLATECDVSFDDTYSVSYQGNSKRIGYNVFAEDAGSQKVTVKLRRIRGNTSCQFAIGISEYSGSVANKERYLEYISNRLQFGLYLDKDRRIPWLGYRDEKSLSNMALVTFSTPVVISDNTGDTTSNTNGLINNENLSIKQERLIRNALTRHANKKELEHEEFVVYLHVPKGQIVPPGSYESKFILTAYEVSQTGFIPKDRQSITFKAKVKDTINVGISKSPYYSAKKTKHTINFRTPDFGREITDNFFINIRANSKFSYKFVSENKGKLKLVDTKPNMASQRKTSFPYYMFVNDQLNQGNAFKSPVEKTTPQGIPIRVKTIIKGEINPIEYQPGSYKDSVHVIVSSDQ